MFLNRLNKEEKVAFLELAHYVARIDGDFAEEERTIIQTYCFEMQIDDIEYDENTFNLENLLEIFQNKMSQKILVLELMALIYSDGYLDENEQNIINHITKAFSMNNALVQIYAEWTKAILAISSQGQLLIEV
jgi:tellurite resistance protein